MSYRSDSAIYINIMTVGIKKSLDMKKWLLSTNGVNSAFCIK